MSTYSRLSGFSYFPAQTIVRSARAKRGENQNRALFERVRRQINRTRPIDADCWAPKIHDNRAHGARVIQRQTGLRSGQCDPNGPAENVKSAARSTSRTCTRNVIEDRRKKINFHR